MAGPYGAMAGTHYAGVSGGLVYVETRDLLISSLLYDGVNLTAAAHYCFEGHRFQHQVDFVWSRGDIRSPWENELRETRVDLQYRFLIRLFGPEQRKFNVALGPQWSTQFSQRISFMSIDVHSQHYSYSDMSSHDFVSSLGPGVMLSAALAGKNSVHLFAAGSLIAYINRPAYAFGPASGQTTFSRPLSLWDRIEHGDFKVVPYFQYMGGTMMFRTQWLSGYRTELSYRIRVCGISEPLKSGSVTHHVCLRIFFPVAAAEDPS